MTIQNRLEKLEEKHPSGSGLYFNCIGCDELARMQEIIEIDKKRELTETEIKEWERLHSKARRDARKEFLEQYDKPQPFDLRTVFNDFKDFQMKHGRTTKLGHAITPAYPQFQEYLINNGYQLI